MPGSPDAIQVAANFDEAERVSAVLSGRATHRLNMQVLARIRFR